MRKCYSFSVLTALICVYTTIANADFYERDVIPRAQLLEQFPNFSSGAIEAELAPGIFSGVLRFSSPSVEADNLSFANFIARKVGNQWTVKIIRRAFPPTTPTPGQTLEQVVSIQSNGDFYVAQNRWGGPTVGYKSLVRGNINEIRPDGSLSVVPITIPNSVSIQGSFQAMGVTESGIIVGTGLAGSACPGNCRYKIIKVNLAGQVVGEISDSSRHLKPSKIMPDGKILAQHWVIGSYSPLEQSVFHVNNAIEYRLPHTLLPSVLLNALSPSNWPNFIGAIGNRIVFSMVGVPEAGQTQQPMKLFSALLPQGSSTNMHSVNLVPMPTQLEYRCYGEAVNASQGLLMRCGSNNTTAGLWAWLYDFGTSSFTLIPELIVNSDRNVEHNCWEMPRALGQNGNLIGEKYRVTARAGSFSIPAVWRPVEIPD